MITGSGGTEACWVSVGGRWHGDVQHIVARNSHQVTWSVICFFDAAGLISVMLLNVSSVLVESKTGMSVKDTSIFAKVQVLSVAIACRWCP